MLFDLLFGRRRRRRARPRTPQVAQTFVVGATLPYRGATLALRRTDGAAAARLSADGVLSAGGDPVGFGRRVESWLRARARERVTTRTLHYAEALGVAAPKVSINDARTRWGSCTPGRGTIRYSWRLVCAPDAILDYVCAHEVAHLREANHGPAFWALVRGLYGDPTPARRWLRTHGVTLHDVGRAT